MRVAGPRARTERCSCGSSPRTGGEPCRAHRGRQVGLRQDWACPGGGPAAPSSVVSDLLQAGAGLPEIGQLLRHRSVAALPSMPKSTLLAYDSGLDPGLESGHERLAPGGGEYIAIRRAVGFKLGHAERMLANFVAFAESEGAGRVSADLAVRWSTLPARARRCARGPTWSCPGGCRGRLQPL